MFRLQKLLKNWNTLVTVVGIILILGIIFSGVDAMYVLVVLGAMNSLFGLYAIITKKPMTKNAEMLNPKNPQQYNLAMGICQIVMGVFVIAMGIIYIKDIVPAKYFWDIVLVGIIVIMVCWYVIKLKARKN